MRSSCVHGCVHMGVCMGVGCMQDQQAKQVQSNKSYPILPHFMMAHGLAQGLHATMHASSSSTSIRLRPLTLLRSTKDANSHINLCMAASST